MNENVIDTKGYTSSLGGCSPFFMTSSFLSTFNAWRNRENSMKNAMASEEFQKELQRQKELYEDQKEAEEWAFKYWLKSEQRKFAQKENVAKLENDLQKADLQMFFKDWPLQISIEAVNYKRKKCTSGFIPISVIVGKHTKGKANDPLSLLYASLVDEIKPTLSALGIDESCIYRFKDDTDISGGAALAYIYSMMSTFPVVVILPCVDGRHHKFNISVGIWSQDSLFPIQKQVLSLDLDSYRVATDKEYLDKKVEEIKYAYIAIAAVMNDSYSLIENNKRLVFPEYAIRKSLSSTFPQIMDFAIAEYKSLLSTSQNITKGYETAKGIFVMPYSSNEQKHIEETLLNTIEALKK